ncbi:cation diffusion facilitator family transporter [Calycomorphotria hydatis]|uniref:Cadmium, cobalt and zinc/H(+)-K(+) antiporter n=1 Tax=Calycomorphotria hydatis TaxID=2528027 RepID=A0A517T4D3_9PLAN|nr:cation transporter [Calycomorphotria hydatis]QDT63233.1 Cadmium, cobalt and zinc/H(+)-K(+) antiporter [Calycomorphotria hydatis]
MTLTEERRRWLWWGILLEIVIIIWNPIEGVVCVALGAMSHSVALVGFGIDSFVELTSAAIVTWRLAIELRGQDAHRIEHIEENTHRIVGGLLLMLCLYLLIDSVRKLAGWGEAAEESLVGIAITCVSLVLMPLLAWGKLRAADKISSKALRADAFETIACAWLSLTTLVGLGLNSLFGWSWADPVAGLIIVPLLVKEGWEGLQGGHEH